MRLTWDEKADALQQPYLQKIEKKKLLLFGDNRKLYDCLCSECSKEYIAVEEKAESILVNLTREKRWASLVSLYDTYKSVFHTMLGERYGEMYRLYLLNISRYPYQLGIYRRSQRSLEAVRHCALALQGLKGLLYVRAFDMKDEELIARAKEDKMIRDGLQIAWFTVQLLQNNPLVIDYLREAMCSDNNHATLTYPMLTAIVRSDNRELLELEGKLLLAARLQEGLRQSIVETMDSGTTEAHLYLMKIILDNDLIRYSSVFRGVLTWCGIGTDYVITKRIPKKIINRIWEFLTDEKQRREALHSNDHMEQYLAWWSLGFYEFQEIASRLRELLHEDDISGLTIPLYIYTNFCYNYDSFFPILKESVRKLHEHPTIIAHSLEYYLTGIPLDYEAKEIRQRFRSYSLEQFFDTQEEALEQFNYIRKTLSLMPKDIEYGKDIFPWLTSKMSKENVALILAKIALLAKSPEMKENMDEWLRYLYTSTRLAVMEALGGGDVSAERRKSLFEKVTDRSAYYREDALKEIARLKDITDDEYRELEENLRYKYEDMRSGIIEILLKRKDEKQLEATVDRLLHHKAAEPRLAGLDIMLRLRKKDARHPIVLKQLEAAKSIVIPSAQEKILIDQLTGKSTAMDYKLTDGLGLLTDGKDVPATSLPPTNKEYVCSVSERLPLLLPEGNLCKRWMATLTGVGYRCHALTLLERMCEIARSLYGREYRSAYGEDIIFGQEEFLHPSPICEGEGIDVYPFAEVWKEFYETEIKDDSALFQLRLATVDADGWDKELLKKLYAPIRPDCICKEWMKRDKRERAIVDCVLRNYALNGLDEEIQKSAVSFVCKLTKVAVEKKQYVKVKESWGYTSYNHIITSGWVSFWLTHLSGVCGKMDDEAFIEVFSALYRFYKKMKFYRCTQAKLAKGTTTLLHAHCPDMGDFCRAFELELVSHDELVRELTMRPQSAYSLHDIQAFFAGVSEAMERNNLKEKYAEYTFAIPRRVVDEVGQRILDIELSRGESTTEVSDLAAKLCIVKGSENLIRILAALGKASFVIGTTYAPDVTSKREMLSYLLQHSRPDAEDTPEQLRELQQQAEIDDKRMVEAALYVPEWAQMIERAIGWEGLTSACYYFHAHVSDECSEQKKAVIARYTPIDVDDFKRGVFDINWFREAYGTLGEKRFAMVYAAAKYVSNGTAHGRARKYADAVTGKVSEEAMKEEIVAKRNKDLLMSYGLIPVRDEEDLVKRYQYIRQFQKESRAFGAQRQNSEKMAVEVALQNLAVNMGYEDVTRLIWKMETLLTEQMGKYFEGIDVAGMRIYIKITSEGQPELLIEQEGKVKKSVPAALKKHPALQEVKNVCKELKAQASRSRLLFEKAMNDGTLFPVSELAMLMRNPILDPLISKLVFISDTSQFIGFYHSDELSGHDKLRIAHPVDLFQSKRWSAFQQYLFEKNIRQPFKQVFRELYMPTAEELESVDTRRYSGYQIQPVRTKALLAGRGWVADYEDGLQRVYYHEDVVAVLYSQCNWFSPSEVECPAIEWVAFYQRRTGKPLRIKDIPSRVFSEIMRDVDLAVSVAHVGGVDPETSHSTIEMRRAIVECILPMFKLTNVSFKGNFVYVEGKIASYNIHLGSAVVHQSTGNAINILPVHSQQRGKLFLPFLDEDPKTAELVSKVLLLAQDEKIKDPFIMEQIQVMKE